MQHLQKTGEGSPRSPVNTIPRWPELANRPGRLFLRSPSPFNCRVSTSCVPLFHGSRNTDHESRPMFFLPYLVTSLLPYLSPPSPRRLLHCSRMARQRLGQHFLADLHWREEIARAIRVSPHSTVPLPHDDQHCWIEIGSGHGEMTQHLLAAGAPVHAIEIDPAFIAGLRHLAKQFPNLIDEIHIVIQTEVALRLAAQPGTRDYGYLSVVTQFYSRPEFVFEIPRDAFNPPPEVTSALVTLRLPGERAKLSLSSASDFLDFVKLCFSKKRKTLVNNLRTLAKPDRAREALASLTLRPDARAEQLSVSQLAALHSLLASA